MKRSLQLVLAGLLCAVIPSLGYAQVGSSQAQGASSADQSRSTQLAAADPGPSEGKGNNALKKDIREDKKEIQKDLQRLRRARKNHDLDDIARDKRELAEDRADLRKDVASPSI